MQTIAVKRCGKKTATIDVDAEGSVSVFGQTQGQRRGQRIEINDIYALPLSVVMEIRDRQSVDDPMSHMLAGYVQEIWELAFETEAWFGFCCGVTTDLEN